MAWRIGLSACILLLGHQVFAVSSVNSTLSNSTSSAIPSSSSTSSSSSGIGAFILQGLGSSQTSTSSSSSSSVHSSDSTTPSLSSTASSSSTTAKSSSGTTSSQAQITPAPNATISANWTGVLVTQYDGFQALKGSLSFEPVQWYGSDPNLPRAQSCWSAITSQQLESYSFFAASVSNRSWPLTASTTVYNGSYTTTTVIYPTDVSTYKLCDGSPRADVKPVTKTITAVSSGYPSIDVNTYTATPTYSATPPCGDPRNGELCYDWYRYSNITQDWTEYDTEDLRLLDFECGEPAHYDPVNFTATEWPCLIGGGPVQLYYFPVDTGNQSTCGNRTAITSGSPTTPPPTVVTNGHTLTSGSVYVSFSTLFAYYDGFDYGPGTGYKDFIITLASSQVSTNCGNDNGIGTQINYADFNYPIPASAYSCAHPCYVDCLEATCTPKACSTIWDNYNPVMAIPTPVLDLQPAWKTCVFADENGPEWLFDPPIALTAAANEAKPTIPGGSGGSTSDGNTAPVQALTSEPAAAKPTPASPAAQQTSPAAAQSDTEPSPSGGSQPSPTNGGSSNDSPPQSNSAEASPAASPSNGGNGGTPSSQNAAASPNSPEPANSQSPNDQSNPSDSNDPQGTNNNGDNQAAPSVAQVTVGSNTVHATQLPGNSVAVAGTTLAPGEAATISGVAVSVDPSGAGVVVASQTAGFVPAENNASAGSSAAVFAAGSMTITANNAPGATNAVVVGGTTLSQGGSAAIINGQTISQGSSGFVAIDGDSTQTLNRVAAASVFTGGSLTITASPAGGSDGAMVVDGTTLSPGGSAAVINGQTISDASGGLVAIGASGTSPLSPASTGSDVQTMAIGSLTITASAVPGQSGVFVVDGTTLSPGGSAVAVVNGTTLSDRLGTLVEVDSRTTAALSTLTTAETTSSSRGSSSGAGPLPASTSRSAAGKAVDSRLGAGLVAVVLSCICIMI